MATTYDSDSNSYEDDEFFHQSLVLPYRFEPSYTEDELQERHTERGKEAEQGSSCPSHSLSSSDRTKDKFWCTCDRCVCMPTEVECVCCHEIPQAQQIVDKFDPDPNPGTMGNYEQKCVTLHPDFDAHLNEGVLDTYFRSHQYNWRQFPKPAGPQGTLTNAQYRLVGYRFILDWVLQGERLGKKKRIPLPACVVNSVREKYPASDNEYTGFKYADLPTI